LTLDPTQHYCSVGKMLPEFNRDGRLPAGIHWATWQEIQSRFGFSSRRQQLLSGLHLALAGLNRAGCSRVYIDGSFVTVKREPGNYDACWDIRSASISASFSPPRCPQAQAEERSWSSSRRDKETGRSKGIVGLNLQEAEL